MDRATKIAKGETRPSRVNYAEPDVPPTASIGPPRDLRGAGFRMWRDHAQAMTESGQLRSTDMPIFHQHCRTEMDIEWWEREKSKRDLERSMRLAIERLLGQIKARSIREAAELGMTSVTRGRVTTTTRPPSPARPDHERFFGGLRGIPGGRAGPRRRKRP